MKLQTVQPLTKWNRQTRMSEPNGEMVFHGFAEHVPHAYPTDCVAVVSIDTVDDYGDRKIERFTFDTDGTAEAVSEIRRYFRQWHADRLITIETFYHR